MSLAAFVDTGLNLFVRFLLRLRCESECRITMAGEGHFQISES